MKFFNIFLFIVLTTLSVSAFAEQPYSFSDTGKLLAIDNGIAILKDPSNALSVEDIQHKTFYRYKDALLNHAPFSGAVWISFAVQNNTAKNNLFLIVAQPSIDHVSLYMENESGAWHEFALGKNKKYAERYIDNPNYIFPLSLAHGETKRVYIKIQSKEQLQVPLYVGTYKAVAAWESPKQIVFGIYFGIILVMVAYHFFLFLSIRSQAYFFYSLFIGFVGLVQMNFQGYAFKFFWPDNTWLALNSSLLLPIGSGLTTAFVLKKFLLTKKYVPLLDKGIDIYILLYLLIGIIGVFGFQTQAVLGLQFIAFVGAFYAIYIASIVVKKKYRPARFFLLAFVIFFACIAIFVLRNFNFVPYNLFTTYILEIGSVIQITLLSFALADQINIYRMEKETSQQHALLVLKENERIIKEQNIFLESEVEKRTSELSKSNMDLEKVVYDLKNTQAQLIESEKLASLGVLTAGIAHEINNPINFVTSNVRPLRRDIVQLFDVLMKVEDIGSSSKDETTRQEEIATELQLSDVAIVKDEINELIQGIEEGANRTAAIVKSLRTFSHVDNNGLRLYEVNDGLQSALTILHSVWKDDIEIRLELDALPKVPCYPGKLNQVFLNVLSNAASAIHQKFDDKLGGIITVKTSFDDELIYISIHDNGVGIDDEVKDKIFDPFFTTKDVGEGIGLGLSIVYQAIVMHQGTIIVNSEKGEGTEFLIQLPRTQPELRDSRKV